MKETLNKTIIAILFIFISYLNNAFSKEDNLNLSKTNQDFIYSGISSGNLGKFIIFLGYSNIASNLELELNCGWLPYGSPILENGNTTLNLSLYYKIYENNVYKLKLQGTTGYYDDVLGYDEYSRKIEEEYSFYNIGIKQEYKDFFLSLGCMYRFNQQYEYSHELSSKYAISFQIGYIFKFY